MTIPVVEVSLFTEQVVYIFHPSKIPDLGSTYHSRNQGKIFAHAF